MSQAEIGITVNGRHVVVEPGTSVAAALLNLGVREFGVTAAGRPTAPLCGMGSCFACRVTVDGVSGVRSCLVPCQPGMTIELGQPDA